MLSSVRPFLLSLGVTAGLGTGCLPSASARSSTPVQDTPPDVVFVANEASDQARDEDAVGGVLAEVVANDVSALISLNQTGGVGELEGRDLIGELRWEQASIVQGAELRLALHTRLVLLPIGSPSGSQEEESDLKWFSVAGFVEHDPLGVTCDRPGDPCRVLSLRDAEVRGEAVHDGDLLTIDLRWVVFGSSDEPEIPVTELLIGDQLIQDHSAARGLETWDWLADHSPSMSAIQIRWSSEWPTGLCTARECFVSV